MAEGKRTVWISLDKELAAELKARGDALSSVVNDVLRTELSRWPEPPIVTDR
jgi:uncharacterized protein (DUF4415 family)